LKESAAQIGRVVKPAPVQGARGQITALPFLATNHDAANARAIHESGSNIGNQGLF
jgi:hypothetical protein